MKRSSIIKKFHLSKSAVLYLVGLVFFVTIWANLLVEQGIRYQSPKVRDLKSFDRKICAITISDWKRFGFVQTLFESVRISNPGTSCFVWFVADDPFKEKGIFMDKLSEIKKIAMSQGIFLVTIDQLSQSFDNFDTKLAFQNELPVDSMMSHILPFALKYTLTILYVESVVYLDPYLWVTGNLKHIVRTKEPHQPVVVTRYLSDPVSFRTMIGFSLVYIHNQQHSITFLQWWTNFYKWDQTKIHSRMVGEEGWLSVQLQKGNTLHSNAPESEIELLLTDFSTELESAESPHLSFMEWKIWNHEQSSFTFYKNRLRLMRSQYFEDIPYGFNHFSDGTAIEPWMRTYYRDMMKPVLCSEEGILLENSPSVYTRIYFQETVLTEDPFQVSLDVGKGKNMTFLQWLLKGPSSQAVDMEGNFYLSEVEEQTYNSLSFYPNGLSSEDALMGKAYGNWKSWFFQNATSQEHISSDLFQKVLSVNALHRLNHDQYHKTSLSSSDIGVNVIGWHGGVFGIAKTSGKMYQAAKAVGIGANAIEIGPEPIHTYLHPRVLGYPLSRSCSEQVNLVMMNGDHWQFIKKEIPEIIWSHKYNIGYWEYELEAMPEEMMKYAKYYDEIWAPTQFTANSVINSKGYDGSIVRVLPLPLTSEIAVRPQLQVKSKALQSLLEEVENAFVFLIVFDFLSSVRRKNPEASIGAFLKAFPYDSDIESRYHLIVKSHHATDEVLKEFEEISQKDTRIHFLSDALSNDDHYALQERADCFVSLHRSEGFGMNILEEMGRGIPVIATNYSGNMDFFPPVKKFMDQGCIFAVPYELVTLKKNYTNYLAGNQWAEADQDYAANAMVTVARNDCKKKYSKEIKKLVLSAFGANAVGEKLRSMLEEIRPLIQDKEKRMHAISN